MRGRSDTIWVVFAVSAAIMAGCVPEFSDALLGADTTDKAGATAKEQYEEYGGFTDNTNDNGTNTNGANGNSNGSGCSGCADFDGDGFVGQGDLGALLAVYGGPPGANPCIDLTGDGVVDQADLGALLAQYGQMCPGGNGNANGGTNGNANGGTNGNANGGTNGNANGGTNGNANGGTNGNANGGTNGNVNGGNGNANGANGNANGGMGLCPDGSTQLFAQMTGNQNNEAEYRQLVEGCKRFRCRVRDLAPFTQYAVVIEGITVGFIFTDDDGRGELEYKDGNFPPNFPQLFVGDMVTVGPVFGTFGLDCSNGNCNG